MQEALPIDGYEPVIVSSGHANQVTVIVGKPGSGKSTRVPIMLLLAGFCDEGTMFVSEPRRICATALATYVSEQFGTDLGDTIGYRIRHQNVTTPHVTRITFGTEGVLNREFQSDPLLSRYSVIVMDEVHEDNQQQALLMGRLKRLLVLRPELKLVIMSATLNQEKYAQYFGGAPIITVEGRNYPIEIEYMSGPFAETLEEDVINGCLKMAAETHGDTLAFVPDYDTIREVVEGLRKHPETIKHGYEIMALYGHQSPADQLHVIYGRTKKTIIIATNVAETSITLEGLTRVVDTGLGREPCYYPATGTYSLYVRPVSKSSAEQRAGRAGRTQAGKCLRLYSEKSYDERRLFPIPEILRSNLDQTFLHLRVAGYPEAEIHQFGFVDEPRAAFWHDARQSLQLLDAIDEDGEVTEEGRRLAEIPLSPTEAKMVFTAAEYGCVRRVALLAAILAARSLFLRPPGQEDEAKAAQQCFRNKHSDFLTMLRVMDGWRAASNKDAFVTKHFLHPLALEEVDANEAQILEIVENFGLKLSDGRDKESVGKSVASGLAANLLRRTGDENDDEADPTFEGRRCTGVWVHPGSSLAGHKLPEFAVASQITDTSRLFARNMHAVPTRWLGELFGIDGYGHRTKTGRR